MLVDHEVQAQQLEVVAETLLVQDAVTCFERFARVLFHFWQDLLEEIVLFCWVCRL